SMMRLPLHYATAAPLCDCRLGLPLPGHGFLMAANGHFHLLHARPPDQEYQRQCGKRTDGGPEEEAARPVEAGGPIQRPGHDQRRDAAGEAASECLEGIDGTVVDGVVGLAVVV